MRSWWIIVGLVAGCGNVKNMADAPPVTGDVLTDTPLSDTPSNAWGAPVKLTTVSTAADEWGPTVRTDLLEMYFASDRPGLGFNDIYVTTRPTAASPWGTPSIVNELSTAGAELQPSLSRDGLTIYLTQFAGANGFDIYKATRTSLTAAWGTPAVSSELDSVADDAPMNLSTSGLAMLVTSTRPGSAGYDVYLATRGSTSQTFGTPAAITSVNTTNNEYDAWLSDDALTIYYTSDINPANSNDLFVATRSTAGGAFTTPTALTALNSSASDEDPWVSTDQHTMIFSSSRDGNRDLWMSTR